MSKKHLQRALTGNYGYVKGPVEQLSTIDASSGLFDGSAETYMETFTNPAQSSGSEEISDQSHNFTSPVGVSSYF